MNTYNVELSRWLRIPYTHNVYRAARVASAVLAAVLVTFPLGVDAADSSDDDGPRVPPGFQVSVFASEPLVRNPCAMAFDARGRLFVGQGMQYRKPEPDTPGDRVTMLIDADHDGVAETAHTFAEGLNHIQGLAWRGDALWVANSPELTVLRDLDGDDVADEYTLMYGGLGNLEHALHGLQFAPDGRLYMSKGNSKGYLDANSSELHVAPQAFADLWGMPYPSDAPVIPPPQVSSAQDYCRGFHNPSDDWGTEGGVLRCDRDGAGLEIFSRGMRNMWDMAYDEHFNWLGLDQDQDGGDRILQPFYHAHFGWGHPWSSDWTGDGHLPSAPISGPTFHGSGTGVVYCASASFPDEYQHVYFAADWLNRTVFVFRPKWQGSIMRNMDDPEVFASAPSGRSMAGSSGLVFDPTDMEIGPDGRLWVLSWGHAYGATVENGEQTDAGRVYRIGYGPTPAIAIDAKHARPLDQWTLEELISDLRHDRLPVWRIDAQDELVRRADENSTAGHAAVVQALTDALISDDLAPGASTWIAWTLGRLDSSIATIDSVLLARSKQGTVSDRVQAIRILADRARRGQHSLSSGVAAALSSPEARVRLAAVQAIHESGARDRAADLWKLTVGEQDRIAFYAAWRALGDLQSTQQLRDHLNNASAGSRLAALLALLENTALTGDAVMPLRLDPDERIAGVAASFVEKVGTGAEPVLAIKPSDTDFDGALQVRLIGRDIPNVRIRYTTDGTEPTDTNSRDYKGPIRIVADTEIQAALFQGRERFGPVVKRQFIRADAGERHRNDAFSGITNIRAASSGEYRLTTLATGERVFADRRYTVKKAPESLSSALFIRPTNDDRDVGSTDAAFLHFTIADDSIVYVAHDRRIEEKPPWLTTFAKTSLKIITDDTKYDLYERRFSAGDVVLGGNTIDGVAKGRSQYLTLLIPAPLEESKQPTLWTDVAPLLQAADGIRGERLFFGQAGCGACHRLGDRGKPFAPNLSNIGSRAGGPILAESILNPSAVITEGFHGLTVITDDGKTITGFIRQESGLAVELVQADGQLISIPTNTIEARARNEASVMPAGYAKLLRPRDVADIIAFLQQQQDAETNTSPLPAAQSATNEPELLTSLESFPAHQSWGDADNGFQLRRHASELEIVLDGRLIARYVYAHPTIQRPFFANVQTPTGRQVTRNFPPIQGQDETDHADMHPGVWMAFANINGVDFWHNDQGRVEHAGIVGAPSVDAQGATFTVVNHYVAPTGQLLCSEQCRYEISRDPAGYVMQIHSQFSSDRPFTFGVKEEMGLGVRVATPITVKFGDGQILAAAGGRNEAGVWGKVDTWWDYSGVVDGRSVGLMLMSGPGNPPVWAHGRDYGALVANPFPIDRKENRGLITTIAPGDSLQLRFAVLVHDTDATAEFDRSDAYARYQNRLNAPAPK